MGLDLYSQVEPYLDFEEEVYALHREFLSFIMENELDNILDIGCGQGYFLENLKINDKKTLGIDLSKKQVEACLKKGLNAKNVALEELKEFKFDCVTAIFDVINYIPKENLEEFFKQVNRVLNENAYFIFDINTYFGFDEVAQGCISIDVEDKFISIDANFEENKLYTNIVLFEKIEKELFTKKSDTIIQEYHSKKTLIKLLKKNNFKINIIKEINLHTNNQIDKLMFFVKKIKNN